MGKKLILILMLLTMLLITSCRDVDDIKDKLTKPYVDTITNATNETKTNLAENNPDTANDQASNPIVEEETVAEEPKITIIASDYIVTTNQLFYLPKDEIKINLNIKNEAFLKISETQRKFDLYRLEDGEFKKLMLNEPDNCYYNDCDTDELNEICPQKRVYECKRYTKSIEEDYMPYVWNKMITDCGATNDAELLKEEILEEGIYKIEYKIYQSSDCAQGLTVSTIFAIKE